MPGEGPGLFVGLVRPLLFAHRGASRFAPENTLAAFDLAVRLGADVIETDAHLSRDGHVVLIHDARLDRTTNGTGLVRDSTYAELGRLDAGYRLPAPTGGLAGAGGAPAFRDRAVIIPRLEDALRAFPDVGFNIELKQGQPSMVRAVLDTLERVGATASRIVLTAGDDAIMAELEAARPGCGLGLSRGQVKQVLGAAYFGAGKAEASASWRGRAMQIPPSHRGLPLATGRVLRTARRLGIETHLWVIDSPRVAKKWLERGVDGVMSNDPGSLMRVFDAVRKARP